MNHLNQRFSGADLAVSFREALIFEQGKFGSWPGGKRLLHGFGDFNVYGQPTSRNHLPETLFKGSFC